MKSGTEGDKIVLKEQLNRVESWTETFEQIIYTYGLYQQISNQIVFNIGHDDQEVIKGLQDFTNLFEKHNIAKSFMVTDFGCIERYLLSSLQNIDENIMLHAC